MLQRVQDYKGLAIQATNGDLGRADDFLFDEDQCTIRYLILSTGSLFGRKVAISPISAVEPDWNAGRLLVHLTQDQIRNSPDLLARGPITRSAEREYATYYGYPAYWGGPSLWGWAGYPGALAASPADYAVDEPTTEPPTSPLRSVAELRGMHLSANDGEIGHVDDLMIDDESWSARYLLVDTSNWINGRHVLVPVDHVAGVDWLGRRVHVDLSKERIQAAPRYHSEQPLARADEQALASHYGPGRSARQSRLRASGAGR